MNRKQFLETCGRTIIGTGLAASLPAIATQQAAEAKQSGKGILIDPAPLFDISPYLYMQFMEPLGVTDSSVEASWSYERDDWRTTAAHFTYCDHGSQL
jgi:alpha-N-arabinofuranosidase